MRWRYFMVKSLNILKRIAAAAAAAVMITAAFTGCGKKEETAETEETAYSGVLTKIRLGMPQNKVIALNNQKEMYYESDTELWCVNPDTDIMEVRSLVPADSQYYYCDDSIITYKFKYDSEDDEYVLNDYMEEVVCLLPKDTAMDYYNGKLEELSKKYNCGEYSINQTGTENVDMTLEYTTVMNLSSFSVTSSMTYTYQTVDGVDDYYCTHLSVDIKELANKTAVQVGGKTTEASDSE